MGTSRVSVGGRWVLDCAQCGRGGGVLRRHCPAGYCPSAQLCGPCYASARASGQWREWHADCARSSAEYRAQEARKSAEPERWASAAWGDWHAAVPAGMVGVMTRARTYILVPKSDYIPSEPLPTGAAAWTGPDGAA